MKHREPLVVASALRLGVACLVAAVTACSGEIASESKFNPPPDPSGGNGAGAAGGNGPGGAGAIAIQVAPTTRFARLTHSQWENSVRDLLRLDGTRRFATNFRADPRQAGFAFDNNALTLEVDQSLWSGYQQAAADAAAYVTGDAARLAKILPASTAADDDRARTFIRDLGARAHRRPLDDATVNEYFALYTKGKTLFSGVAPLTAGVRLVLEAMLQSPYFVYRVESSTAVKGDVVPLDGHEVATRLSYALWDTMPDDALFAAAAGGVLTDAGRIGVEVQRLLGDARAEDVVHHFHHELFEVPRFGSIAPSRAFFPSAPATLAADAIKESELFLRDTFKSGGGLKHLLTSTGTFVNANLAAIYGLAGTFGTSFVPATLDPTTRRGIFTQVGFLASHATPVQPDPIHRGVFMAHRVACIQIAAPPGNIPPLPAAGNRTNRELVEAHTEAPGTTCAGCHSLLVNPFGFAFENFDAIGAIRTMDNNKPVNTMTTALVNGMDGDPVPVRDAVDMLDKMAASSAVHECYARHLIEFVYGRPASAADAGLIAALGRGSLADSASVKDLVVSLASSRAFLNRSTLEVETP